MSTRTTRVELTGALPTGYKQDTMEVLRTVTTHYDVAEHLRSPAETAAFLEARMEEAHGDGAFIAKALGAIARAKGMSQVAELSTQPGVSADIASLRG